MKKLQTNEEFEDLDQILEEAWVMLRRGVTGSKDPFHTPALGTVSKGGCNMRTVVLREALEGDRILICHTDIRSPKVGEIQKNPGVNWLFYHPEQNIQLRLAGRAELHTDDELADRHWAATPLRSRRQYCALDGPGTPRSDPSSGLPEFLISRNPTYPESEAGRKNFVVIVCRIDFLDWLLLRGPGNVRAQFGWLDDRLTAAWVTP